MSRHSVIYRKKRNAVELIVKITALMVITAAFLLLFARTPVSLSYFTDRVTSQTYNIDM
jgi:hypothetical protein